MTGRKLLPAVLVLVLAGALAAWYGLGHREDPRTAINTGPDPLAARGFAVTAGAAPGYVEDRACALCHADLARSFREVGMARSFYRPSAAAAIEDFSALPFFHPPSGRYYEIERAGDEYTFRRYLLDESGARVHPFETRVDWILGSGNHSRTYLYATPGGELYQLPLAWYTRPDVASGAGPGAGGPAGWWGMAPGYDRPDHQGVTRRARRECMFCHNAYPDVADGSDLYGEPQTYPAELPEGIGCQRCHGPGAEHSRVALAGGRGKRVRATIVNPARLSPERSRDVCYGCHMQPSVALAGLRRFERGDYSFRPGEALTDYQLQVDVTEEGRAPGERFEINHHPYRLEQSRCFVESGGALSCLTCHDPHRKVPAARRAEHYRQACLGCHQLDDCTLDAMTAGAVPGLDPADCAGCHMATRRTEDVVQVVMTDHRISRLPGGPELTAPRAERDPTVTGIALLPAHRLAAGADAELYRAAAAVQAGAGASSIAAFQAQIAARSPSSPVPNLELARAQLVQRRFAEAEAALDQVLALHPGHPLAEEWKALARAGQGDLTTAIQLLRQAVGRRPDNPEAWFNLGRILNGQRRHVEAVGALERALALRPNSALNHAYLARSLEALGRTEEAENHRRRTLEIDPSFEDRRRALRPDGD